MSLKSYGPNENLTLSEEELGRQRPRGSGPKVRAFCPFHGSDHQRSLQVNLETGSFRCFQCGAWGYLAEQRAQHRAAWLRDRSGTAYEQPWKATYARQPIGAGPLRYEQPAPPPDLQPCRTDLAELLARYQGALPGSPGEAYLRARRIPVDIAQQYGLGYAAAGAWAHVSAAGKHIRQWKHGRIVFPHHAPDGTLLNLYGRAVDLPWDAAPKELRHDHLPGNKGYFNATCLLAGDDPVFVCEGPFDALSLIVAGYPRSVAIFGVHGWCWAWARSVDRIILALDADPTGQHEWRQLARAACLHGKQVAWLPPEAYGGQKDISAAWQHAVLCLAGEPQPPADSNLPEPAVYHAYLQLCLRAGVAGEQAMTFARIMTAVRPSPLWSRVQWATPRPHPQAILQPQWDAESGMIRFAWNIRSGSG